MKEIELINKRKKREKHFLQEDGTIIAKIYDSDIHYLKNDKYEEIDNRFIKDNNKLINKNNSFKITLDNSFLFKIEKDNNYIILRLKNSNYSNYKIKNNSNKIHSTISYENIIKNVDIKYDIYSNKVKESIILKSNKVNIDDLLFEIDTNLVLKTKEKSIFAYSNDKEIFTFDSLFMIDYTGASSIDINYELYYDKKYYLKIVPNMEWIMDTSRKFPIIIDPTIIVDNTNLGVYDTYIFDGDTNINRNNTDILKVGVEKINNVNRINRTLLKFDLPELGTGSQVINAKVNLIGYYSSSYSYDTEMLSIHAITENWDESTANWNQMHDKYNNYCESCFESHRSYISNNQLNGWICSADITNLAKKWYTDLPNYGMLIKAYDEVYKSSIVPAFYSKDNTMSGDNPKPTIEITYRNQNGLLNYLEYDVQEFFRGKSYVNIFNGNLTTTFNLANTYSQKFPVMLNLIYNTNDVILNNDVGLGKGYRFNYNQTIKKVLIGSNNYLEYCNSNGTLYYFKNKKEIIDDDGNIKIISDINTFYDEDGLNLAIIESEDYYTLKDNEGTQMLFIKNNDIGKLNKIIDSDNNIIEISYDNEGRIISIFDKENNIIEISYDDEIITINSSNITTTLGYINEKISNIKLEDRTIQINYINNLISNIVDINGKSFEYQYYENVPFRIKKVIEHGLNNLVGKFKEFYYGTDSTTITDNKNRTVTTTFDSYGHVASTSNLSSKGNIINGYGKREYYGNSMQNQNRLIASDTLIKPVVNLLTNVSFEDDIINFTSNGAIVNITSDFSRSGERSLKINFNSLSDYVIYSVSDLIKGKYYTFSSYIKSDIKIKLSLLYYKNDDIVEKCININETNNFIRDGLYIFYDNDATSDLIIKISPIDIGNVYIDDIQLEEGETINYFNYIENGDFSKNYDGWELESDNINQSFSIVDIQNNKKALKIKMNPNYPTALLKELNLKGTKNDMYTLSFWYKNSGVHVDELESFNDVNVICKNNIGEDDEITEDGFCAFASEQLNINLEEWQFFCETFYSLNNYNSVLIAFSQTLNANELLITDICLFKDIKNYALNINSNGDIFKIVNSENGIKTNKNILYNSNNKLVGVTGDKSDNYSYEYNDSSKIICGITDTGIYNKLKYDFEGKNKSIISTNNNLSISSENDTKCKIRLKNQNNYVAFKNKNIFLSENKSNHIIWKITPIKIDDIVYYKICSNLISDRYFGCFNNSIVLCNEENASLFIIEKNNINYYNFKLKDSNEYLCINDNKLSLGKYDKDSDIFDFYLEKENELKFLEGNDISENNNSLKYKDTVLREIQLDYDDDTKLLTSTKNYNNHVTNFEYDNRKRLIKVECEGKYILYDYYSNDNLKGIHHNNKYYNFEYDEFLNQKNIKINNRTYITNYFENNNGNLNKVKYGNNQKIFFEYDEFDRLDNLIKNNKNYKIKYDFNNNIHQILSSDNIESFIYDGIKRLSKYINNDFTISYNYNDFGFLTNKLFALDNQVNKINYFYDKDNKMIRQNNNEYSINYVYDELDRIVEKTINDFKLYSYSYVENGKRTSPLIKKFKFNNDEYVYKYNKSLNVSHIYCNGNLIKKYIYDSSSQLIMSYDFEVQIINKYKYDESGNIIEKSKYKLNDYSFISTIKYEYKNEEWEDLLTKYNNEDITYDEIGNPISIGNNITLNWVSGRELNEYNDTTNNINVKYSYNQNGIRTQKIVNNILTEYYLENKKIIYEKTNNNIIYYIYESNGTIIGFKYNNNIYYYIKNGFNDIIGIINSNNELIANYSYDDWGNIISITDSNGIEITDKENIAIINPFRYRGYYYDNETKLYYLNDRYYNPVWGRFINADKIIGSNGDYLGYNLFAYCSNNPINGIDENGKGKFLSALFKIVTAPIRAGIKLGELVIGGVKKFVSAEITQSFGSEGKAEKVPILFMYKETKNTRIYNSTSYINSDKSKSIRFKFDTSISDKGKSHSITIDGGSYGESLNFDTFGLSKSYHKYYNDNVSANIKIGYEFTPDIIGSNFYIESYSSISNDEGLIIEDYVKDQVDLLPAAIFVYSFGVCAELAKAGISSIWQYLTNLIEPIPAFVQ